MAALRAAPTVGGPPAAASGGLGPGYHNDPRGPASKSDIPPLKPIAAAGTVHFEQADSSADEYSEPESECASQPPMRPQTPAPPRMRASSRPPPTQFMSAALRHPPDGQPLHDARPKNGNCYAGRKIYSVVLEYKTRKILASRLEIWISNFIPLCLINKVFYRD